MDEKKDIRDLLDEEIVCIFDGLKEIEIGTEEYAVAVNQLQKLYDLRLQEAKIQMEDRAKTDQRDYDDQVRRENAEKDRLIQKFKIGVDVAGILLPLLFYSSWIKKGLKFEEHGVFTSTTFRNFFSKLKPTVK